MAKAQKPKKPTKPANVIARPAKTAVLEKPMVKSTKIAVPFIPQPLTSRSSPMTEQMEKATQSLIQICEDVNAFARATVDANLRSVTAAAKGWDESSKSAGHLVQENLSRMLSVGKTVAEAKSLRDIVTMQQDFMKDCVDLWMANANKLSEISARTAKDVVEPVTQNANDAISRIMQKARAA